MTTPTLGRIVLFSPEDAPGFEFPGAVTLVHPDGAVALTVFQPDAWAGPSGSTAVDRAEASISGQPEAGRWRWPPRSA